jgi:type I restriction enzyme R subunit
MKIYNTHTGQFQLFNMPDEVAVEIVDFNHKVITENFNRTVCQTLALQAGGSAPERTRQNSLPSGSARTTQL